MRVATALSTALREAGHLPRRAWPRLRAARPLTNELRQRISHRVGWWRGSPRRRKPMPMATLAPSIVQWMLVRQPPALPW